MRVPTSPAIVRVDEETHATLKRLSDQENEPMQAILAKAVERYRRAQFVEAANGESAALRRRPKEWRDELAEREAWDKTLADGSGE